MHHRVDAMPLDPPDLDDLEALEDLVPPECPEGRDGSEGRWREPPSSGAEMMGLINVNQGLVTNIQR